MAQGLQCAKRLLLCQRECLRTSLCSNVSTVSTSGSMAL
jgi:hypothetical protein